MPRSQRKSFSFLLSAFPPTLAGGAGVRAHGASVVRRDGKFEKLDYFRIQDVNYTVIPEKKLPDEKSWIIKFGRSFLISNYRSENGGHLDFAETIKLAQERSDVLLKFSGVAFALRSSNSLCRRLFAISHSPYPIRYFTFSFLLLLFAISRSLFTFALCLSTF